MDNSKKPKHPDVTKGTDEEEELIFKKLDQVAGGIQLQEKMQAENRYFIGDNQGSSNSETPNEP